MLKGYINNINHQLFHSLQFLIIYDILNHHHNSHLFPQEILWPPSSPCLARPGAKPQPVALATLALAVRRALAPPEAPAAALGESRGATRGGGHPETPKITEVWYSFGKVSL